MHYFIMIIVYKILQIKARSRQKYVENRVLIKHSYFKSVKLYVASEMTHSVFFLFFLGGRGGCRKSQARVSK